MNELNLIDLLITKFKSSSKEAQEKLLSLALRKVNNKNMLIDILNNKKIELKDKKVKEGDDILIKIEDPTYPSLDLDYYKNENLIVDDLYIRCKLITINPFTDYAIIEVQTKDNSNIAEISTYYILEQTKVLESLNLK